MSRSEMEFRRRSPLRLRPRVPRASACPRRTCLPVEARRIELSLLSDLSCRVGWKLFCECRRPGSRIVGSGAESPENFGVMFTCIVLEHTLRLVLGNHPTHHDVVAE